MAPIEIRLARFDPGHASAPCASAFGGDPQTDGGLLGPAGEILSARVRTRCLSLVSLIRRSRGPSGFGYASTAEQVTEGLDLRGKRIL